MNVLSLLRFCYHKKPIEENSFQLSKQWRFFFLGYQFCSIVLWRIELVFISYAKLMILLVNNDNGILGRKMMNLPVTKVKIRRKEVNF